MLRLISSTCFVISAGTCLLLKACLVKDELTCLAMGSLFAAILLTHFLQIRSLGLAGLGGYSLVYSQLGTSSQPAKFLLIFSAGWMFLAILFGILADLPIPRIRRTIQQ